MSFPIDQSAMEHSALYGKFSFFILTFFSINLHFVQQIWANGIIAEFQIYIRFIAKNEFSTRIELLTGSLWALIAFRRGSMVHGGK